MALVDRSGTYQTRKAHHHRVIKSQAVAYCLLVSAVLLATYKSHIEPLSNAQTIRWKSGESRDLARRPCRYHSDVDPLSSPLLSIHDPTIRLDPSISRPWLLDSSQPQPPYKLILTDYGWNHPNVTYGLGSSRSMRSRELMHGLVDHPFFDPTISWSDIVEGRYILDEDTRYYVFLDVETCFESNYPFYGAANDGYWENSDTHDGRSYQRANNHPCFNAIECHYINTALDTIHKFSNTMLVVYNCRGWGPGYNFRNRAVTSKQLSLVAESAEEQDLLLEIDQGLPPGPLNVVKLSQNEIQAIHSCNATDRPFLVTFVGAPKVGPRTAMLHNMSNGRDVIFLTQQDFQEKYFFLTFHESLKKSVFGAAPKGDNLYSYRFTEVLSAGAIPVVHADDWVMPFHKALFDWNETCAIVIPEAQVYETEHILRGISKEERCRRQRNCLEIYQKYFATPQGTVAGIVEALERIHSQKQLAISQY